MTKSINDEYFTPNSDRVQYTFKISEEDYLYTPSLLIEGDNMAGYRDSIGGLSHVYLSVDESKSFDQIIDDFNLKPIQGILLCAFVNMRFEDKIGPEDSKRWSIIKKRKIEMQALSEFIELLSNDQISIFQNILYTVSKDNKVRVYNFSNRSIHKLFRKHIYISKHLELLRRDLESYDSQAPPAPEKGQFKNIKKRLQAEYAHLLYNFLSFIKNNSTSIYNTQIIDNDSQIYLIIGKLMHISQFYDTKKKIEDMADADYISHIPKKIKKLGALLRKNQTSD